MIVDENVADDAGFWYLATPYTRYLSGTAAAFRLACLATAQLAEAEVRVFSPIVHGHPLATFAGLDWDHAAWLAFDQPFMLAARGLIVVKAPGWQESAGIAEEIKVFEAAGKPILWMEPREVPAALTAPGSVR